MKAEDTQDAMDDFRTQIEALRAHNSFLDERLAGLNGGRSCGNSFRDNQHIGSSVGSAYGNSSGHTTLMRSQSMNVFHTDLLWRATEESDLARDVDRLAGFMSHLHDVPNVCDERTSGSRNWRDTDIAESPRVACFRAVEQLPVRKLSATEPGPYKPPSPIPVGFTAVRQFPVRMLTPKSSVSAKPSICVPKTFAPPPRFIAHNRDNAVNRISQPHAPKEKSVGRQPPKVTGQAAKAATSATSPGGKQPPVKSGATATVRQKMSIVPQAQAYKVACSPSKVRPRRVSRPDAEGTAITLPARALRRTSSQPSLQRRPEATTPSCKMLRHPSTRNLTKSESPAHPIAVGVRTRAPLQGQNQTGGSSSSQGGARVRSLSRSSSTLTRPPTLSRSNSALIPKCRSIVSGISPVGSTEIRTTRVGGPPQMRSVRKSSNATHPKVATHQAGDGRQSALCGGGGKSVSSGTPSRKPVCAVSRLPSSAADPCIRDSPRGRDEISTLPSSPMEDMKPIVAGDASNTVNGFCVVATVSNSVEGNGVLRNSTSKSRGSSESVGEDSVATELGDLMDLRGDFETFANSGDDTGAAFQGVGTSRSFSNTGCGGDKIGGVYAMSSLHLTGLDVSEERDNAIDVHYSGDGREDKQEHGPSSGTVHTKFDRNLQPPSKTGQWREHADPATNATREASCEKDMEHQCQATFGECDDSGYTSASSRVEKAPRKEIVRSLELVCIEYWLIGRFGSLETALRTIGSRCPMKLNAFQAFCTCKGYPGESFYLFNAIAGVDQGNLDVAIHSSDIDEFLRIYPK